MSQDSNENIEVSHEEDEDEVKIWDIIKERKEERRLGAEQKRRVDLQRIKDMKSKTGIDPLQLFPKEIWLTLFNELDTEDRDSVWKVHPIFQELLENTRIWDILFPQLLKLEQFRDYIGKDGVSSFKISDFGKLRCISKSFRTSIDRWVDDNLKKKIHQMQGNDIDLSISTSNLDFSEVNDRCRLEKILANFSGGITKSFFTRELRAVVLYPRWNEEGYDVDEERANRDVLNKFTANLNSLLEIIGSQIWHFSFGVNNWNDEERGLSGLTPSDAFSLFKTFLSLMPNLKWIEFGLFMELKNGSSSKSRSFPRLSALQRITFCYNLEPGQTEVIRMYEAILEANQHIKILEPIIVDGSQLELEFIAQRHIKSLDLTSFSICSFKEDEDVDQGQNITLEEIQGIVNCDWKLKSIRLRINEPGLPLSSVLHFLENFPTLERVSLDIWKGVKVGDTETFGYLSLPNLTGFKVKLTEPEIDYDGDFFSFFSLNFLLRCKKLKKLDWTLSKVNDQNLRFYLWDKDMDMPGKLLNFKAGLTVLYDSKIWKVFPQLDIVKVECLKLENEDCKPSASCEHEYRREDLEKGMGLRYFLDNHGCCLVRGLHNCVMLSKF